MSVGVNSNIVGTRNIVSKPSVFKELEQKIRVAHEKKQENIKLSKELFNESLLKNYNSTGLFKGYNSYEGSVNDKVVSLNENYNRTSFLSGITTYNGIFDNDKTNLSFESKPFDGTSISGFVGDKQVELTMKTGFFSGYQIAGTIDGKEINITKGADLSAAQGENDILTLVGSLMGYSYNVQDGKFGTLGLSEQAYIEQQQMMAIQQQQMFQQQQMMDLQQQQMFQQQMMMNNQMMGF